MTAPAPLTLAELQARLQDYVLDGGLSGEPSPPHNSGTGSILSELKSATADEGKRRLHVYYAGYRLRMKEVLQGAFEHTWGYLGDDAFDAVCSRYIQSHPSREPNLRDYGSNLPGFLTHILPGDPDIAEVATMDWRLHSAFDAPNAPILTGEQLAAIDEAQWASLGFIFHPSVSLALFEWNALEIWHALNQARRPPEAKSLSTPTGHLFWRHDQRSYFRSLEADEYAALKGLLDGHSFAQVCEQLAQSHPDTATDAAIGTWLARWLADELLSEVMPGPVRAIPQPA